MRSHDSGEPPSAAASRIAISALTAARPFTTRESATRDTPSLRANSLTLSSARTLSRSTSPGCGGLCILLISSSVIVHVIDEHRMLVVERENQPPVAAHRNRPRALRRTLQRVKAPAGQIQVCRPARRIESTKLQAKLRRVRRLDPGLAAVQKEALQPFVAEAADHCRV